MDDTGSVPQAGPPADASNQPADKAGPKWWGRRRVLLPAAFVIGLVFGAASAGSPPDAEAPSTKTVADAEQDRGELDAQREELDALEAALLDRERELNGREEELVRRERSLDRREERVALGEAAADEPEPAAATPAEPEAPQAEVVVEEFRGSGQHTTRPFQVGPRWEIQWEAAGDIFQIYVYDAGGDLVGVAANQQGSGSGSAFQPRGGSYYLEMNAIGSWVVRIVQLP